MAQVGNIAADQLRSIVERIERLECDKANVCSDIRDVYAEAKANGYDVRAIRQVIKLRGLDTHERDERQYTLDLYCRALGLLPDVEELYGQVKDASVTITTSEGEIYSGPLRERTVDRDPKKHQYPKAKKNKGDVAHLRSVAGSGDEVRP